MPSPRTTVLKILHKLQRALYRVLPHSLKEKYEQRSSTPNYMKSIFTKFYRHNLWGNPESRSGDGSDLSQTEVIRRELPVIIAELEARSMLDIPCGDFNWMRHVELELDYTGADIVDDLIRYNQETYGSDHRSFVVLDTTRDPLPKVDIIFCRDVLVHFSYEDIFRALENIVASGSRYLITTTFPEHPENRDIPTGQWRTLDLQSPPFGFPPPLRLIVENCTEGNGEWADKSLGVWRIKDVARALEKTAWKPGPIVPPA